MKKIYPFKGGSPWLTMAGRHLLRRKKFALINILGLSTGIATCLLIYGYVHYQNAFDAYNAKADRIARVTTIFQTPESELMLATANIPLAGALLRECPQVEAAVRIGPDEMVVRRLDGGTGGGRGDAAGAGGGGNAGASRADGGVTEGGKDGGGGRTAGDGEKRGAGVGEALARAGELMREKHFVHSEQAVFSIFSFSFLEGSPAAALTQPNSIVLTESTARKYFGNASAMGKTLLCDKKMYHVTAVIADRPAASDIKIDALLWKDYQKVTSWVEDDFEVYTFVLFRGRPDLTGLQRQFDIISRQYVQPQLDSADARGYHERYQAEMLKDVHFSKGKMIDTPKGNKMFNAIFSILAIFILVVALLNYINLSTARAEERAKEVAVRKVAGASPLQLMGQFMGESFFMMAIAWLLALGTAELVIPYFNKLLEAQISLGDGSSLLFFILAMPVTAVLAGAWPAFILSGFQPVRVLKGFAIQQKGVGLRKVLMVVQFIITLAMLTGTVVIYRQMHYILHKDLGADRSQMIALNLPNDSVSRRQKEAFSRTVRQESSVRGTSMGSGIPIEGVSMGSTTAYANNGKKRELMCNYFFIDPQFLPLLHIGLAEGRNFSDSLRTDRKEAFIVNEAFVRTMGWSSGAGKKLEGFGHKGAIVGVVKDFFFKSLHNVIEPMVMVYADSQQSTLLVKSAPSILPRLKTLWAQYYPSEVFDYYFLDESFDSQYQNDRVMMTLFNAFTLLSIFISCLGLYGLVSLITARRTREIGIRKVLGAPGGHLVFLLTREFLILIGCAALVALPLAGWGLERWLSSYAYHTSLTGWMFGAPLAALILITLSVTGLRVMRAVRTNPVESLRAE